LDKGCQHPIYYQIQFSKGQIGQHKCDHMVLYTGAGAVKDVIKIVNAMLIGIVDIPLIIVWHHFSAMSKSKDLVILQPFYLYHHDRWVMNHERGQWQYSQVIEARLRAPFQQEKSLTTHWCVQKNLKINGCQFC